MAIENIDVTEFLFRAGSVPVLDVRSPTEYASGHIPGAINFPILDDEERAAVGTCYKRKGHEAAVLLGYELVGKKFSLYVKDCYQRFAERTILLHCFRGGLRSRIMAYLLHSAGFKIAVLIGGYKSYRHRVQQQFSGARNFKVLGGYTGSGKTKLLQELKEKGLQVLDIEKCANHRGSAFGSIGLSAQPTQEHFENLLAHDMMNFDTTRPVWVEDESRMTGRLKIPDGLYDSIRKSKVFFVEIDFEVRCKNILEEYCKYDTQALADATLKLRKRLGDMKCRQAVEFLGAKNYEQWLEIVLSYYDRAYLYGLSQRESQAIIRLDGKENFMKLALGEAVM